MDLISNLTVVSCIWGDYYKYLPDFINNLEKQGIENLIIVTNDKSGIKDLNINIKIILTKNINIGYMKNIGLNEVKTEYVNFADVDDLVLDNSLIELITLLENDKINNNKTKAAFATGLLEFNNKIFVWPNPKFFKLNYNIQKLVQIAKNHIPFSNGTVIKTKIIKELEGFPEWNLAEDGAIATLMLLNYPMIFLNKPTRLYNIHENGLSQRGHSYKIWKNQYKELRKYLYLNAKFRYKLILPFYILLHNYYAYQLSKIVSSNYANKL